MKWDPRKSGLGLFNGEYIMAFHPEENMIVDLSHSFSISGIMMSKSGEVKIPQRKSVEKHLNIGAGSWPWVILRMEPEEREASLQALESWHVVFTYT
jgi:hypothetical protein